MRLWPLKLLKQGSKQPISVLLQRVNRLMAYVHCVTVLTWEQVKLLDVVKQLESLQHSLSVSRVLS